MIVRELLTLLGFKSDDKAAKNYDKVLSSVLRTTKIVTVAAAAMGAAFLKGAGDMEQTQIAFETMLGSAEAADALIKDITAFAAKTPFQLKGLVQSSKQLLAYGFAAEEIIPTMTNLGNIAAGVGKDKLPSIILAFGKIRTKGKATMEELNIMLEAGVPILDELAKNMGVTKQEITKLVSKGVVGFDDVNKALSSLGGTGGRFAGLMEKQSRSFLGIISNIGDFITNLVNDIGKDLLPGASKLAKAFLSFMEANREVIRGTLSKAFIGIGKVLVIVFTIIRRLIKKMGGLKSIGKTIGSIFKAVFALLKPMLEGFIRLWPHLQKIVGNVFGAIINIVKGFVALFKGDTKSATDFFNKAIENIKFVFAKVWTIIKLVFSRFWNWFKKKNPELAASLERIWEKLSSAFKAAFDSISSVFKGIVDFFTGDTDAALDHFADAIANIPVIVGNAVNAALQLLEELFPALKPLIDAIQWIFEKMAEKEDPFKKITATGAEMLEQLRATPGGVEQLVEAGYLPKGLGKDIEKGKLSPMMLPAVTQAIDKFLREGNKFDVRNQNTYNIEVPAGTPKEVVDQMAIELNKKVEEQWQETLRQAREQAGIELEEVPEEG